MMVQWAAWDLHEIDRWILGQGSEEGGHRRTTTPPARVEQSAMAERSPERIPLRWVSVPLTLSLNVTTCNHRRPGLQSSAKSGPHSVRLEGHKPEISETQPALSETDLQSPLLAHIP